MFLHDSDVSRWFNKWQAQPVTVHDYEVKDNLLTAKPAVALS